MPTMLIVSCRKDFWSATEFAPTDEIRDLDLDTGTGPVITHNAFVEARAEKRITVLVHGYNNERLDVLGSYRTIDAQMRLLGFLGGASVYGRPGHVDWDRTHAHDQETPAGRRGRKRGPHRGRTVLLPGCLIPLPTGATTPSRPHEQNLRHIWTRPRCQGDSRRRTHVRTDAVIYRIWTPPDLQAEK